MALSLNHLPFAGYRVFTLWLPGAQGPINALSNGIVNFEADGNGKREAGDGGAGNKSGCNAWNAVTKGGLDRAIGDITIPISDDPPSDRNCLGIVGQWNP
jgi:hypothetical protein